MRGHDPLRATDHGVGVLLQTGRERRCPEERHPREIRRRRGSLDGLARRLVPRPTELHSVCSGRVVGLEMYATREWLQKTRRVWRACESASLLVGPAERQPVERDREGGTARGHAVRVVDDDLLAKDVFDGQLRAAEPGDVVREWPGRIDDNIGGNVAVRAV